MSGAIRIPDMPNLGTPTDDTLFVADHAGSGVFSGTALSNYVGTNLFATLQFATVADLRAYSGAPQRTVSVQGLAAPADGGEGLWICVTSDTTTADNTGTVVVDAAGRRWYRAGASGNVLSVLWFGAKGDGTTNDAAAITAAIAALPATGGVVQFPPRRFAIASTLTLGNGSTAGASTRNGIVLRGVAGIQSPSLLGTLADTGTRLVWTGTTGPIVQINGPAEGCGIQNMTLDGGGGVTNGLVLVSASFGDFTNLSIRGCTGSALRLVVNTTGSSINCMHNRFHDIFLNLPDVASVQGIYCDGTSTQNACFNDFENMFILLPATHNGWGIYLRGADSNTFRNVLIYGGSAAAVAVLFDYTSAAPHFPCSNSFYGIDPLGLASSGVQGWVNNGTPTDIAAPNFLYGLYTANGATWPNLPNLIANPMPATTWIDRRNLTAAVASTAMLTPNADGFYRIDYNLTVIGGSGTAGTIAPAFGMTIGGGLVQSLVGASVPANVSGGTSSGSFSGYAAAGLAINYQVAWNGVVGTPAYNIFASVQRLR